MSHALVIIDLQKEMQRRIDEGRDYVGTTIEANILALRHWWESNGLPVVHVQHHSADAASPFYPEADTAAPMDCAVPRANEAVFMKHTSSAFESTTLDHWLRQQGITELTLVGAVLGFCVSSTARSASDKGYSVHVVTDAVLAFDFHDRGMTAHQVFDVELAHLEEEFARLTDTELITSD